MLSLRYLRRSCALYRPLLSWATSEWGTQAQMNTVSPLRQTVSLLAPKWFSTANRGTDKRHESSRKGLVLDQEDDSITDKIPDKPMTATESISYSAIILAAFAVGSHLSLFFDSERGVWAFVSTYIWDPIEYTCFNIALEKIRQDPRVTVRLGESIKGYGSESRSRTQRHMIRNRQYKDTNGVDHIQIQFNVRGNSGGGVVYADMYRDGVKKWQYTYLYVDIPEQGRGNSVQRIALVTPNG